MRTDQPNVRLHEVGIGIDGFLEILRGFSILFVAKTLAYQVEVMFPLKVRLQCLHIHWPWLIRRRLGLRDELHLDLPRNLLSQISLQ